MPASVSGVWCSRACFAVTKADDHSRQARRAKALFRMDRLLDTETGYRAKRIFSTSLSPGFRGLRFAVVWIDLHSYGFRTQRINVRRSANGPGPGCRNHSGGGRNRLYRRAAGAGAHCPGLHGAGDGSGGIAGACGALARGRGRGGRCSEGRRSPPCAGRRPVRLLPDPLDALRPRPVRECRYPRRKKLPHRSGTAGGGAHHLSQRARRHAHRTFAAPD